MKSIFAVCALSAVVLLGLSACASPSTSASAADGTTCEREYPTGSSIPVNRCRTADQAAKDKAGVDQMRDAARSNTGMGGPSPAGGR